MMAPELLVAWRYLKSKKGGSGFVSLMSLFSFIGILLGVATLIIVLSIMTGFKQKLMSKILDFNAHVSMYMPGGGTIPDYETLLARTREALNVTHASLLVEDQGMLVADGRSSGVMVRGVTSEDFGHSRGIGPHIKEGASASFASHESPMIVGAKLAEKLNLRVGSSVSLMVNQGTPGPFGYTPRQKTFEVVGLFDVGMSDYNATYVFIPLEIAQPLFKMGHSVSAIEVDFKNPDQIRQEVRGLSAHLAYPGLIFMDWQKRHASFFEAIVVQRNVMFIILGLIILIAAFNIVSSLVMMVKDKTRAIGILRAIGMTRRGVLGVFLGIGSMIGVSATLLGALLGVVFCWNIDTIRHALENLSGMQLFSAEIYYLTQLPVVLDPQEVITVMILALALSFLATLYPAWKASKLKPVEALRYDS